LDEKVVRIFLKPIAQRSKEKPRQIRNTYDTPEKTIVLEVALFCFFVFLVRHPE